MKQKIYEIIESDHNENLAGKAYNFVMMAVIIISIVPLIFKEENIALSIIDYVSVGIFIIDYILRLVTADFKLKKGAWSYIRYPFTPMAIIDLITIIPTFVPFFSSGFKLLKIIRLIRTFKVFRVFKGFRYSKNIELIMRVIKREKSSLVTVFALAIGYILVVALIMFNIEPETFNTFFDAVYWSCISLTTMGYGDIYAISVLGKVLTMLSALVGIAIVALPTGIISSGFLAELNETKKQKDKEE